MDDYTLIIPTYQRPAMLRATLTHLAKSEPRLQVVVLDSSSEPALSLNRATLRAFPRFQHREFDPSTPFVKKLLAGLREVSTPFVSLSADDDLLYPAAVE